jgi:CRP-like cAMP-binding protein
MMAVSRINLLEVEPELARFLTADERAELGPVWVPTEQLQRGAVVDVCEMLEAADSFAAFVLEGMLLQRLRVGEQFGLTLMGPGDVVSLTKQPRSMLLSHGDCHVAVATTLALLGGEVLVETSRWPQLTAGLHVRAAEQLDRLTGQLVICQLPRVEDRLLAILWLLAESWGHVTRAGTSLPISLTHDVLGGLIGARRSTVTLALGELSDRGAVVRQGAGWLLLEPPPPPSGHIPDFEVPSRVQVAAEWKLAEPDADPTWRQHEELLETVARLRQQHDRNKEKVRVQLERLRRARETRARNHGRALANAGSGRRGPLRPPSAPS